MYTLLNINFLYLNDKLILINTLQNGRNSWK